MPCPPHSFKETSVADVFTCTDCEMTLDLRTVDVAAPTPPPKEFKPMTDLMPVPTPPPLPESPTGRALVTIPVKALPFVLALVSAAEYVSRTMPGTLPGKVASVVVSAAVLLGLVSAGARAK